MQEIQLELENNKYSININDSFSNISDNLMSLTENKKIIIITDDNVAKLYLQELIDSLKADRRVIFTFVMEHGEPNKNIHTVMKIYDYLLEIHADRFDLIISLGGGVVGDIAGYVAATYLRGIDFIQVPTTLLAQVDSSVGGKVGIDYNGMKNIVGAFYQPRLVYINIKTLKTLPRREIVAGLAEVMVHGLIADADLITFVRNNFNQIMSVNTEVTEQLIYRNCCIKANIVKLDEKEKGLRKILNFGHTVGHAVESLYEYQYNHGECVSIGIVAAFKLAVSKDLISVEDMEYVKNILVEIGLPIYIEGIKWEKIVQRISYDKKTINNRTSFIFPTKIGHVEEFILPLDDSIISTLKQPDIY